MAEATYNLRPLWNELLGIYKEFFRICEQYNLRHWVIYGTLIGAVRHQGFIPWDDDFDVAMPREDYDRFQKIVQSELPDGYLWKSIYTDSKYNHTFGKIFNTNAETLSRVTRESNLNLVEGLFVDVFPFDGVPSTRFGFFFWQAARAILRRHVSIRTLDWWLSRWRFDRSELVCNANSGWGDRNRMVKRREWVASLKQVPFEDVQVFIPSGYDAYLRCEFDDYMQLPPLCDRVPAHQLIKRS